jgi:hypothetical protein
MNEKGVEQFLDEVLEKLIAGDRDLKSVLARHPDLTRQIRPQLEAAFWLEKHARSYDPSPRRIQTSWLKVSSQLLDKEKRKSPRFNTLGLRLQSLPGGFILPFVIIMLLILGLTGSGFVYAAQDSLPNDSLYDLKRSVENAQLTVTLSDEGQAKVLATIATKRLHEAYWAAQADRMGDSQIALETYIKSCDELFNQLNQLSNQEFVRILDHLEHALSLQQPLFEALASTFAAASPSDFDRLQATLQAAEIQFITLQSLVDTVRIEAHQKMVPTPSASPDGVSTPTPEFWQTTTPTESFNGTSATPRSTSIPSYPFESATPDADITATRTPSLSWCSTQTPDGSPSTTPSITPSQTPGGGPSPTPSITPSRTASYFETSTPWTTPTRTPFFGGSETPTPSFTSKPSTTPSPSGG